MLLILGTMHATPPEISCVQQLQCQTLFPSNHSLKPFSPKENSFFPVKYFRAKPGGKDLALTSKAKSCIMGCKSTKTLSL